MMFGQDRAVEQFRSAWDSGNLHHAWLLAGPRGVGKATFARAAARRVLADAAGPRVDDPGIATPADHRIAKLIDAGSHPDLRSLERLENAKTGALARNISVDQVRELGAFLNLSPALSPWRAAIIDTVDDLEEGGANALLKMLEEPPPNTLFLLVSHVPGRLLPTIRSRCRRLDFQRLGDDAMTSVLDQQLPDLSTADHRRIAALAGGSAGRAMAIAALDLAKLEEGALGILRHGDPTNARRSELADQLGRKNAGERYAAFIELLPALIAREARALDGAARERAVDAYARARDVLAVAPRLSLDRAATIFELGGILASVPDKPTSLKR